MSDREKVIITAADVGVLNLGKNAILTCSRCRKTYDKGAPAQPGQNDASFVCEDCQEEHNAKSVADGTPTIVIDGSST